MGDAREVGEALEAWLRERGHPATVNVVGRATVGLSQETWLVDVVGEARPVAAVLRLPTPASGARAILTQRAVLQAVASRGILAPRLLWHDDGHENRFGRPFLVMERVAGTVPAGWSDLPEPSRTALAEQAIDVLVALHAIDPGTLATSGELASGSADFEWYQARLKRFEPLPPVLRGALWWLERHRPPRGAGHRTLVHGDYRMGNFVVDDGRLQGVLDWEMASIGDPLADLAWCFIPVWEIAGVDEAAMVRRYAEGTGAPVDADRLHWHRVLAYVRLAYYAVSGTAAFDRGRSDDLRLAALRLQLPVHLDRLAATLSGRPVT